MTHICYDTPEITLFAVRFVINFGFEGSDFFTAVPLKNHAFLKMTLPCWVSGSQHSEEQIYSKCRQTLAKRHTTASQI